jgi:hypothetical protein
MIFSVDNFSVLGEYVESPAQRLLGKFLNETIAHERDSKKTACMSLKNAKESRV